MYTQVKWTVCRVIAPTKQLSCVALWRPTFRANFSSTVTLANVTGKSNILLMGPPGSGKSTISANLSKKLGMPVLDVDDHMEVVWGTTVANKLSELGDDKFLVAEAEIAMKLVEKNTIISLSGSNPLDLEAMNHLKKDGILVFLDVIHDNILNRAQEMKVDRIVGADSMPLEKVLSNRIAVYEDLYDVRILVEDGQGPESIADQVVEKLGKDQRFFSTRDISTQAEKDAQPPKQFFEVVRRGLADDRGLYFPSYFPKISLKQLERLVDLSYHERALRILELFPLSTLPPPKLRNILYEAYSSFTHESVLPLSHIEKNLWQLEEYHGPTASFKDLALQVTPRLFKESVSEGGSENEQYLFMVATSGDTGSACLDGFGKNKNTPVIVLYPNGGVSKVQEAQMASCEGDVCVLSINGDFDYCQTLVKDIFNSPELQEEMRSKYKVNLTSGNSINWGRLFPQIPYTFSAYLDLVKNGTIKMGEPMDLCVPSGNFGNILGGVIAQKMGLPVDRLISACNENNTLSDFLRTGTFDVRDRTLVKTPAPSIDILLPSNLERFLYMATNHDANAIKTWFTQHATEGNFTIPSDLHKEISKTVMADWCDSETTYSAIKDTLDRTQILLDPHTAVGKVIADRFVDPNKPNKPMVIAGTAHYTKFPDAVMKAVSGKDTTEMKLTELFEELKKIKTTTAFHPGVEYLTQAKVLHTTICPADKESVLTEIRSFLQKRLK